MFMNIKLKYIIKSSLIAAIYFILTLIFACISYSLMQIRIAKCVSVLAYFTLSAIPGLALGCLLLSLSRSIRIRWYNIGTAATAISAYIATKIKNKFLVPLPYIITNALIMGGIFSYMLHVNYVLAALSVSISEALAIYILVLPIIIIIEKISIWIIFLLNEYLYSNKMFTL